RPAGSGDPPARGIDQENAGGDKPRPYDTSGFGRPSPSPPWGLGSSSGRPKGRGEGARREARRSTGLAHRPAVGRRRVKTTPAMTATPPTRAVGSTRSLRMSAAKMTAKN